MIKLKCNKCEYTFEVSEKEFQEHPELYVECFVRCGGSNTVVNVKDVVALIVEQEVKVKLDKWFNELGIEGTIEMLERNSIYEQTTPFFNELRKRGLIK